MREKLDGGMNAPARACIEQLVLTIEGLHPYSPSRSIEARWSGFSLNPDLTDDNKRPPRADRHPSLELIENLRNADDGSVGIEGRNRV
jgi:hypothetical protein